MIAEAYKLASCFTQPLAISTRFFDETVECQCGAFIVLNEEGWIISVAHLWRSYFAFQQNAEDISNYNGRVKAILQGQKLNAQQKRERIRRLKANPKWVTYYSFWWGRDGVQLKDIKVLPEGDLVTGRLEPFDPKMISFES